MSDMKSPLTSEERRLLCVLLEQLSQEQGNAGCNDWSHDMKQVVGKSLRQAIVDHDGGGCRASDVYGYDWMATNYLIARLDGRA